MNINWRDFAERVGWTAIQATAGAFLTVFGTAVTWQEGALFVAGAVATAVAKVVIAQQAGTRGSGDAFPGGTS